MSKNPLLLLAVAATLIIMGEGCAVQNTITQTSSTYSALTLPFTDKGTKYSNLDYNFSLVLPPTWGSVMGIKGDIPSGVKIYDSIRLVAKNDPLRYFIIHITKHADADASFVNDQPFRPLGSNSLYTFYYSGGGAAGDAEKVPTQEQGTIFDEVYAIAQSFKLASSLQTYSSEKYSFKYPKEYSVSATGGQRIETYSNKEGGIETIKSNDYILTVLKNDQSKLEIFIASEYPGDRAAFGFSGEETPEEAAAYIKDVKARSAKEYLKVGNYDAWLYYSASDTTTKKELREIFDSIIVKY